MQDLHPVLACHVISRLEYRLGRFRCLRAFFNLAGDAVFLIGWQGIEVQQRIRTWVIEGASEIDDKENSYHNHILNVLWSYKLSMYHWYEHVQ